MFHKHEWKIVAAQNGYKYWNEFNVSKQYLIDTCATVITYQCEGCDKFKQEFLKGHVADSFHPKKETFAGVADIAIQT